MALRNSPILPPTMPTAACPHQGPEASRDGRAVLADIRSERAKGVCSQEQEGIFVWCCHQVAEEDTTARADHAVGDLLLVQQLLKAEDTVCYRRATLCATNFTAKEEWSRR